VHRLEQIWGLDDSGQEDELPQPQPQPQQSASLV
jgi:hypothetical protein